MLIRFFNRNENRSLIFRIGHKNSDSRTLPAWEKSHEPTSQRLVVTAMPWNRVRVYSRAPRHHVRIRKLGGHKAQWSRQ